MTGSKKSQGFIYVFLLKELDYEQSMLFGEVRRASKKVCENKLLVCPAKHCVSQHQFCTNFFLTRGTDFTEKQGQPVVCQSIYLHVNDHQMNV